MEDESDSDGTEGILEDMDEEEDKSVNEQSSPAQGTLSAVSYSSAGYRKGYKGQLTATRLASNSKTSNLEKFYKIVGSEVEGRRLITRYGYFNAGI